MSEIRWILAALGVILLLGIWWWGGRRSRQAPGNAELREAMPIVPEVEPHTYADRPAPRFVPEARERVIAHLEPLDIRTATLEEEPLFDEPMTALVDPIELTIDLQHAVTDIGEHTAASAPAKVAAPSSPDPPRNATERLSSSPRSSPNTSELQRIVAIRVCATGEARWPGQRLMDALESLGLAFGRYEVYHRKHVDGRSLFCVASLIEPGIFDVAQMPTQEFRGVTLFAVLPGPLDAVQTLDALFETAGGLAEELTGVIQDHKGVVMTASGAVALRAEMAQFQTLLAS